MKVVLVSSLMRNNDISAQINQIEHYLKSNQECDLLCFGECYLQGFDSLSWDYEKDQEIAITVANESIKQIQKLAQQYNCGLSFGFIEKENNYIFCSNLVINQDGEIVNLYRRRSPGWKIAHAEENYTEGEKFHTFTYGDKTLAVAICGDLWHEDLLKELIRMEIDALLWPVYIDYSIKEWQEIAIKEYTNRTKDLAYPVLMINSFSEEKNGALGGCYVFEANKISKHLSLGNKGVLKYIL